MKQYEYEEYMHVIMTLVDQYLMEVIRLPFPTLLNLLFMQF